VAIDIPTVLVDLRSQVVDAHRSGLPSAEAAAMKAAAWAFGSGSRLGAAARFASLTGGLAGRMSKRTLPGGRRLLSTVPFGSAWTGARDLPAPGGSFRAWWKRSGSS
jgi:L-lactate dehydrogenase complex protein LldF